MKEKGQTVKRAALNVAAGVLLVPTLVVVAATKLLAPKGK